MSVFLLHLGFYIFDLRLECVMMRLEVVATIRLLNNLGLDMLDFLQAWIHDM